MTQANPVGPPYRYSMSKAGTCARTMSANMLGLIPSDGDTPEYLRLAAREGNRHETWIREDLKEFGWDSVVAKTSPHCKACDRNGIHVELRVPETGPNITRILVGHMDDINYRSDAPTDLYVGEYKALGRFSTDKLQRLGIDYHRTYATQVSLYHYAMNQLPILYVVKNRDTGRMNLTVMEEPPLEYDTIMDRLSMLEEYLEQGELAPCDMPDENMDKWSCTSLCDDPNLVLGSDILPEQVTDAVRNMGAAKVLKSQAKILEDENKSLLMAYLHAKGGKKLIEIDNIRVALIPEGTRKSYDIPNDVKANYVVNKPRPAYLRITERTQND